MVRSKVRSVHLFAVFPEFVIHIHEGIDHVGVEVRAAALHDDFAAVFMGIRRLVAACKTQGIVDIRHGQDPGCKGNSVSLQAVRVAAAVPFFMVVSGNLNAHTEDGAVGVLPFDGLQGACAMIGMRLNDGEFLLRQSPRFYEDVVGNRRLSYIVQGAGAEDVVGKSGIYLPLVPGAASEFLGTKGR